MLVVAAGLAVFMASVDASIVNVSLPAIEHDVATTPSVTEWVLLVPPLGQAQWVADLPSEMTAITRSARAPGNDFSLSSRMS